MSIGQRIRQLRGSESRKAFGDRLNIAVSTIMRYENGDRIPDADFIALLCNEYRVTSDWLIFGETLTIKESQLELIPSAQPDTKIKPDYNKIAEDWALDLTLDQFDALWEEFRNDKEWRRGWLQAEVIKRFPEFITWLEQRQAPLTPAHIAALKKGGQLPRFSPPDQPDDD